MARMEKEKEKKNANSQRYPFNKAGGIQREVARRQGRKEEFFGDSRATKP